MLLVNQTSTVYSLSLSLYSVLYLIKVLKTSTAGPELKSIKAYVVTYNLPLIIDLLKLNHRTLCFCY